MKNAITTLLTLLVLVSCRPHRTGSGMMFETDCPKVNEAWELAVKTVRYNIRDSILAAGADYGGEWTRDVAINTWNGTDLFIPEVMERSLWHVTDGRRTVGHQYWDKIIWVQGAYYHYLLTRDTNFLKEAYICSRNTMKQLETVAYDPSYGLFTGPSVFNDGISAFEEPIYDASKPDLSGVMQHNTRNIKCLSTNCVYYMAYRALNEMHRILGETEHVEYAGKAETLKENIRRNFFSPRGKLYYAIDEQGGVHKHQEALGNAFAILSGIVTPLEGHLTLIRNRNDRVRSPFDHADIQAIFQRASRTAQPFDLALRQCLLCRSRLGDRRLGYFRNTNSGRWRPWRWMKIREITISMRYSIPKQGNRKVEIRQAAPWHSAATRLGRRQDTWLWSVRVSAAFVQIRTA